MSDSYRYDLVLDDTNFQVKKAKLLSEYSDFQQKINQIGSNWQALKLKMRSEINGVLGTVNSLITMIRNVVNVSGEIIDPMAEYIFGLIGVTVTTLMNMSIAAGSTVLGAPLAVAIAAAAGAFNIIGMAQATAGLNDAKGQWGKASALARSMGTFGQSLTWAG